MSAFTRGSGFAIGVPLTLLLVAAATGCQWNVGELDVRLVYTSRADRNPLDPVGLGVQRLRVRIEGPELAPRLTEFDLNEGAGVLPDVPSGQPVRLTVEALNSLGSTVARGSSTEFVTGDGDEKLFLFISRVEEFSDPPSVTDPAWSERFRVGLRDPRGRAFHAAAALADSTVLVAGGTWTPTDLDWLERRTADQVLDSAERFDPTAGAFLREGTDDCSAGGLLCLQHGRAFLTLERLPDREDVLVIGGEPLAAEAGLAAEIYGAAGRSFTPEGLGMSQPRSRHSSAGGGDAGVWVAGGVGLTGELLDGLETFEDRFRELSGSLSVPRAGATLVMLADRALTIGGWETFEEWPPAGLPTRIPSDRIERVWLDGSGRVELVGHLLEARAEHTAVRLLDTDDSECVFVCGGLTDATNATSSCERIDPADGTSVAAGDALLPRWRHTATALRDGRVLVAGGFTSGSLPGATNRAVILDPLRGKRPEEKTMMARRAGHTATVMDNGMILLVGGIGSEALMASLPYEIFNP